MANKVILLWKKTWVGISIIWCERSMWWANIELIAQMGNGNAELPLIYRDRRRHKYRQTMCRAQIFILWLRLWIYLWSIVCTSTLCTHCSIWVISVFVYMYWWKPEWYVMHMDRYIWHAITSTVVRAQVKWLLYGLSSITFSSSPYFSFSPVSDWRSAYDQINGVIQSFRHVTVESMIVHSRESFQ